MDAALGRRSVLRRDLRSPPSTTLPSGRRLASAAPNESYDMPLISPIALRQHADRFLGILNPRSRARSARPSSRRPWSKRRRLITWATVAAVLAAPLVVEAIARALIDSRIHSAASEQMTGDISVGLSDKPAILQIAQGEMPYVDISSDDTQLNQIPDVQVNVHLDDVRLSKPATVQRTQANVVVPSASIASAASNGGLMRISAVQPDPSTHSLLLQVDRGLANVTVQPSIANGRVVFKVSAAQLLGQPAPASVVQQISDSLASRSSTKAYPLSLKATSVSVTDSGVQIALSSNSPATIA